MSAGVVAVIVIVGGVVIVIFVAVANLVNGAGNGCRLVKQFVIKDYCAGSRACPPGTTCVPTGWRRYGFWGWQPASCGCATAAVPMPGSTPATGGGATSGSGGSSGSSGTGGGTSGETLPGE